MEVILGKVMEDDHKFVLWEGKNCKIYPCTRANEKPQQDSRRGGNRIYNQIPYPPETLSSNKTLCATGECTETEPDLLLSV